MNEDDELMFKVWGFAVFLTCVIVGSFILEGGLP